MFCSKCGKEIMYEAVICHHCGCPTKALATAVSAEQSQPQQQAKPVFEKNAKRSKLFGTVAFALLVVSFMFVMMGISDILLYYEYGEEMFDAAFMLDWIALGFAITSFVFGVKTKNCLGVKYVSTLIFIMSIVMLFVPVCFFLE